MQKKQRREKSSTLNHLAVSWLFLQRSLHLNAVREDVILNLGTLVAGANDESDSIFSEG